MSSKLDQQCIDTLRFLSVDMVQKADSGHHTFAFVSDGDLMEGVASEAASLAGHLKLGKLTCLYDDNSVTLAAGAAMTFSEDRALLRYRWRMAMTSRR
ncbi:transketolase [Pseudomonas sp. GGS8]|uniref:hypothetical protein n=1 Tax=Pseudomonas sp. GGS8 TaxID=2817892 RepID=UPI00209D84D8|nr:hypothetical protein [Pseudomonas sp. GGS8]MCP1446189.1 transketolase [Pseudomonas sp. GGS8]